MVGKMEIDSWKVTTCGELVVLNAAVIKNVFKPEQKLQRKGTVLTTQGLHVVAAFVFWLEQELGLFTLGYRLLSLQIEGGVFSHAGPVGLQVEEEAVLQPQ
jgi:hypothetical protein